MCKYDAITQSINFKTSCFNATIGPRKKKYRLYSLPEEPCHKLDKKDMYNIDVFKSVSYFKQLFI